MKIKNIKYQNYKGLKIDELSFNDHLTVVIGKNGAGKTSVLSSIVVALSWIISRLKSEKGKGLYIEEDAITNGKSHSKIEAKFDCFDSYIRIPNESKKGIQKKYTLDIETIKEYTSNKRAEFERTNFKTSIPTFVYYGVRRAVIDIPLRVRNQEYALLDAYTDFTKGSANFRDFFTWFRNQEDIENEYIVKGKTEGSVARDLDTFRNALQVFMPEYTNIHIRRNPLRMLVEKEGKSLNVNQLSDGEKIYLALIGDLCHRLVLANPTLDNPLQGEGIVLIDEIDLHLHPEWQGSFAEKLPEVFPNIQFIVTTHSPHVLNHVQSSLIRKLENDDLSIPDYSYGMPTEIVLKDVMNLSHDLPIEIEKPISEIYLELNKNNLNRSKELCAELESKVPNQPELIRIRKLIERLERRG